MGALVGLGFGGLALGTMLARDGFGLESSWRPPTGLPHFPARAKSVIWIFLRGGLSHMESFDPKPALAKWHGQPIPVWKKEDAFMGAKTKNVAMASPYTFARHGQAGIEIAETYPFLARHADKLCVIRSMHAESNNHGPGAVPGIEAITFPISPPLATTRSAYRKPNGPCGPTWTI